MVRARAFVAAITVTVLAGAASSCAAFHGSSRHEAAVAKQGTEEEDPAGQTTRRSIFEYPWMWTDEKGERVALSRWRGEPVLVTAIYTQCQATCPRTIGKLRKLDAAFRREGHVPEFILVTLDPRNDTPERLLHFKEGEGFPESWHLLTGGLPETRELADLLDIHVLNADSHIMHDARIVIFDAEGMPFRRYSGWSLDDESTAL